jgi:multisubunit Na+/H+ antiporter MnhC subunit
MHILSSILLALGFIILAVFNIVGMAVTLLILSAAIRGKDDTESESETDNLKSSE